MADGKSNAQHEKIKQFLSSSAHDCPVFGVVKKNCVPPDVSWILDSCTTGSVLTSVSDTLNDDHISNSISITGPAAKMLSVSDTIPRSFKMLSMHQL